MSVKIIFEKSINNPQFYAEPFTFAVIDSFDDLELFIEQFDVLGTKYWHDPSCIDVDIYKDINFYFYLNLNSKEIPDKIWKWLSEDTYSGFLHGIQYYHASYLRDVDDRNLPNQTLDSLKLLRKTIVELQDNDYKHIGWYSKIIEEIDFRINCWNL